MLTSDSVKKASPGMGLLYRLKKTGPSRACVCPLWWPRLHRLQTGRRRLTGAHADASTPKQHSPRERLGEKALDGAVTAA